jgi:hypothetical protein
MGETYVKGLEKVPTDGSKQIDCRIAGGCV